MGIMLVLQDHLNIRDPFIILEIKNYFSYFIWKETPQMKTSEGGNKRSPKPFKFTIFVWDLFQHPPAMKSNFSLFSLCVKCMQSILNSTDKTK